MNLNHVPQFHRDLVTPPQAVVKTAAVAQSVRAFASYAEGWVFESEPRHALVVKTGSDSSTTKSSVTGVSVMGPRS